MWNVELTANTPNSAPRTPQWGMVWLWAALLVGLALTVKSGSLIWFDRSFAQWMEAIRTPGLDVAARTITFFGSSPWTLSVVTAAGLWWLTRRQHMALLLFVGAGMCGLALHVLLRVWVAQWRPDAVVPDSLNLVSAFDLAGFPSGHAFRSAFLYGWWAETLGRRARRWATAGVVGCGLLIFLVGASRVYVHRHWATDVVGGWLLALTTLAAVRGSRP